MDAAHTEALIFAVLAAFFFTLSGLALRLRLRTGQRNQWLWAGLIVGVGILVLVVVNLNGVVIGGVGGSDTHREHSLAPPAVIRATGTAVPA